ncbi:MAG: SPOR domain-containing protein [Campylobacteraceae bacterium]|jgi:DedD protein|nr:SPOR domain-containing protein [Campylobacteraceae bacterium]
MDEHELSDILLEQMGSKNSTVVKIKRLLVIAILVVLLFVVVLMIMRFINASDEQPQNILTQTMLEESTNIQTTEVTPPEVEDDNSSALTEESATENVPSRITEITQISPNITEIPSEPVKEEPVKKLPPKQQSETVTPPKSTTTPRGWYIQVSSSANTPTKSFLDNIAKKGYSHHQYKTTVNSKQVIKILVGPYSSDKDARAALLNVKSDINKDAFVYQVK